MKPRDKSQFVSTLLQIQNAVKAYGIKSLFADAAFAVNEGEHIGVIGPNGAGKTTLFKVLVGDEELDSGQVIRSQHLRLGYLAQHENFRADETVQEHICHEALMAEWELQELARGLGIQDAQWERPVMELSGGYRMRVKLVRLLGQEPNLLLLDEPTNYLDLETLLVLESFLLEFKGAFLLISHDREFLRRTTDHILEVESGEMTKYPGSIDDYFEQKEMLRSQLEARAMSVESRRKEIMDFVTRFGAKASKAKQAQSRLKSLGRLEKVELKPVLVQAKVKIPAPDRISKLALELTDASVGFGTRTILGRLNLQILGGDHIGVVGLNGAGKTTLLRTLAGELPLQSGTLQRGYGLELAYYGQIVPERLNPNLTVYDSLMSVTDSQTTPQDVLDMAGSLLFSGDAVRKKVSVLSGGEKSRVALGQVLLKRAACLLLDEPTNHLDFYTVEAMTQSLQAYPGTVITVSHDRGFIRRVATKILEVKDGSAWVYPGNYEDYVWSLSQRDEKPAAKSSPRNAAAEIIKPKSSRGQIEKRLKEIRKRILEINRTLEKLQLEMTQFNEKLLSARGVEAQKISSDLAETQNKIDGAEAEWLELGEEETSLQNSIS